MTAHTHARTHTQRLAHIRTRARARTHTHTHTHTPVAYPGNQGNETEEKVFKKRKVFKEDLEELTEVEMILRGRVSRFGLALSRGTSVQIRFGSPFSSKVVVCGHCIVTLSLTIMKH